MKKIVCRAKSCKNWQPDDKNKEAVEGHCELDTVYMEYKGQCECFGE